MSIQKLEAGKSYRLIDKEGWFNSSDLNRRFYDNCFSNDIIDIEQVSTFGNYLIDDVIVIDGETELQYFEEVKSDVKILWDGESPLLVDMWVKLSPLENIPGNFSQVVYIAKKGLYVLEDELGHIQSRIKEGLYAAELSAKDKFLVDVLEEWKSQGIDFAQDTMNTQSDLQSISIICWEVFNREGENI